MPIVYQNIRIKIKKAMNLFKNKNPRKIKLIKRLLKNKKTIVKVDFKISTSVIVNVLKGLGYNFDGFLMAILLWAIVFFILRLPWQFLIKKKHGLIYCSIYLLILVVLVEEYSYWSLITEINSKT